MARHLRHADTWQEIGESDLVGIYGPRRRASAQGPPPHLRQLTDKLEAKAALTFERLRWLPAYDGQ